MIGARARCESETKESRAPQKENRRAHMANHIRGFLSLESRVESQRPVLEVSSRDAVHALGGNDSSVSSVEYFPVLGL
jgi:hypothetical protein